MKVFMSENPCLSCGAGCAFFRVSFYWGETDRSLGGSVPIELTEDLTEFRRCMKGTDRARPRCAALLGTIGETVRCSIHPDRPTPCRKAGVQWENGVLEIGEEELERCDRARAAWNLPPLSERLGSRRPFNRRIVS